MDSEGAEEAGMTDEELWMTLRSESFDVDAWIDAEYLAEPPRRVRFGMQSLDEAMPYGLRAGVNVIMAEPGSGKTALGCHLALTAAMAGQRAAVISMEMPAYQTWLRMAAEYASMSGDRYEQFAWSDDDEWRRKTYEAISSGQADKVSRMTGDDPVLTGIAALWREVHGLLVTDLRGSTSFDAVTDEVGHLAGAGCDLVVVDYLQRITAPGGSRYESLTAATHALTDALRDTGMVGVVISSMGRGARRSGEVMAGADGTGAIEYDAESVWKLSKEEMDKPLPGGAVLVDAEIAKSRHGMTTPPDRPLRFIWYPRYNVFK